jgi:hypothetical protein
MGGKDSRHMDSLLLHRANCNVNYDGENLLERKMLRYGSIYSKDILQKLKYNLYSEVYKVNVMIY